MNKQYRIKKSDEIETVLKKGTKAYSRYFICYKYINNETTHFRFATSVGKKIGNAVVRNHTKRRIRAAIDTFNLASKKMDVFIIAKPSVNELDFNGYLQQIKYLLEKLHIID
ncbi:MAG: ribonuclease P protein component [Acholeplasmatales bacterium]|nr:ribonuclease P protein component [Acholeplasmatales bacterium]